MANAPDNLQTEPHKDRINPTVFYGSAIGIVAFALWTMIFTDSASATINALLGWISDTFGWFYFVAVVAYLVFVIVSPPLAWASCDSARRTPRRISTS